MHRSMALTQRLEIRQSQALVMTPQLMQAIKLLQLSNLDLAAYVETELEKNPLLERSGDDADAPAASEGEAQQKTEEWSGEAGKVEEFDPPEGTTAEHSASAEPPARAQAAAGQSRRDRLRGDALPDRDRSSGRRIRTPLLIPAARAGLSALLLHRPHR